MPSSRGPRRAPMKRATRRVARASASATSTSRSRSQSVVITFHAAPRCEFKRRASLWYENDCSQTRSSPHGSAVTMYTPSATTAASAASRTRRRASSSTTPAMTTAGTDNALIDAAAPPARPTQTASHRRGSTWSSARSASAIASTDSAIDGPSALTGPVTQSTDPLVVTSPAASRAWPRDVTRRAHE